MKRLICWTVLLCLMSALSFPALSEAAEARSITKKSLDFYYNDLDTAVPGTIYFIDGSDVPYLALSDWQAVIDGILGNDSDSSEFLDGFEMRFSMEGSVGVLTREDGYTAAFDCDADTLRFLDYDAFLRLQSSNLLTDMVLADEVPDGPVPAEQPGAGGALYPRPRGGLSRRRAQL